LIDDNANRAVPIALGWQSSPEFNPMTVVEGHAPTSADEVVIDRATARAGHFAVGETVRVLGPSGAGDYRLAGVVTYGGADDAVGAQVVAFAPETAATVFGTPGRYSAIQVRAQDGLSESELASRVHRALHDPSLDVITGATAAEEARDASGASLQFMNSFLMMFAVVALVVGSFVIYNAFSITVAQRTRETALLRAIGAKRRQVKRAVKIEALCTGLFASVVGVIVGIGLAQALRWVIEAFGMSLPDASLVVLPRTIFVSIVLGVVVTVFAASWPARKAAKVKPIEALRNADVDGSRIGKVRTAFGVLATLGGAALLAGGLSSGDPGNVGLGALAVFIGVAMLGPAFARPFVRLVGRPIAATRGMAGTLARENAARNPKRTAATASSLMIGIGLVVLITVFAASTKASLNSTIDDAMKGDYIVRTQFGMGGMTPDVAPVRECADPRCDEGHHRLRPRDRRADRLHGCAAGLDGASRLARRRGARQGSGAAWARPRRHRDPRLPGDRTAGDARGRGVRHRHPVGQVRDLARCVRRERGRARRPRRGRGDHTGRVDERRAARHQRRARRLPHGRAPRP
jgi:putative ABC transport system permease protein